MSFVSWSSALTAAILLISQASAFTGSEYTLTHEYSGVNFFDGWDFFTVSCSYDESLRYITE